MSHECMNLFMMCVRGFTELKLHDFSRISRYYYYYYYYQIFVYL